MLDLDQRVANYTAQTGRTGHLDQLTPPQRRRALHKAGHQSTEAAAHRQDATKARAVRRERRKSRLAGFSFAR